MGRGLLFLVGGMFIVVGIVQSGINNRSSLLPLRADSFQQELHATNTVNSAMDYALREIIYNQSWNAGLQSDDFMGSTVSVRVYDQHTPDKPHNNIPLWDEYTLLVHGVAEFEDQLAVSEMFLRKDSFSKYSYFTDEELTESGQGVFFIWSDELSGPVHSNGQFNIAGDPTFYGMVTSPHDWNGFHLMENDPNFFGGSDFDAEYRDPPNLLSLQILKNDAASGGLSFDNEVRLEFLEDGMVQVQERTGSNWDNADEYTVDLSLYNGVISSSQDISMRGTIDGQYTVHSEQNIRITGDVRYNEDPADHPGSTDLLGIVSEKEVVIDKDAHRHSGSSDLTVQGSIMALDSSFGAEDYESGSARGDLNLLGGIVQQRRGPMGTFSGGQIRSGFNKSYEYDERLMNMNPPSFPRESFFSIVHWLTNTAPKPPPPDDEEEEDSPGNPGQGQGQGQGQGNQGGQGNNN